MELPSLLHHIFNADSRKVGFGWWLFIVSTTLLWETRLDSATWQTCVLMSTALIGGGTVADGWLKNLGNKDKKDAPATPPSTPQ